MSMGNKEAAEKRMKTLKEVLIQSKTDLVALKEKLQTISTTTRNARKEYIELRNQIRQEELESLRKTKEIEAKEAAAETVAEETKAEETKAEETKAEETKAEETKAEETKAEETKAEETETEEVEKE